MMANIRKSVRIALAGLGLAGGLMPPTPASAACLGCGCSVSAQPLAFGTYNPSDSGPTTTNAKITVNCGASVLMLGTVDVSISPGGSTNANARTMANGGSKLSYNIYQDAAYSTVWGSSTVQTFSLLSVLSFSGTAMVYGRIPALQWVKSGTYTDSLVVTVTY